MPHVSYPVHCVGPGSPHAFDMVPLQPRNGTLDIPCPVCRGHGQWNTEIDLASFRCQRAICGHCLGAGWVESGDDLIGLPDIVLSPDGHPQWTTRYVSVADMESGTGPPVKL